MIIFTPEVGDKVVKFEGVIPTIVDEEKINQVVVFTTATTREETFTGTIKSYNINVTEIDESNYKNLMYLFKKGIAFDIEDSDTGYEGCDFTFNGNKFGLNPTPDKDKREIVYSGSIPIIGTFGV